MRLTLAKKTVILFSTFSPSQFCKFYLRYFLTLSNFFLIYVFHCLLVPPTMLSLLLGQPFLSKWGIKVTPNPPQFNVKREGGDEEEVRAGWGGFTYRKGVNRVRPLVVHVFLVNCFLKDSQKCFSWNNLA